MRKINTALVAMVVLSTPAVALEGYSETALICSATDTYYGPTRAQKETKPIENLGVLVFLKDRPPLTGEKGSVEWKDFSVVSATPIDLVTSTHIHFGERGWSGPTDSQSPQELHWQRQHE
jgi:hypothetical protein